MAVTQAQRLALNKRRARVSELYLQSWTQCSIAEDIGVTQQTISNDLKWIRREWRESSIRDFDEARERELQKIDLLEREAWQAWLDSRKPKESTRVTQSAKGKQAQKTVQQRPGDPRFLDQIHKCIASRRAILGLDAPTRISPTSPEGDETYHARVMAELMRLAEESGEGPDVIDAVAIRQAVDDRTRTHPREDDHAKPADSPR